MDPHDIQSLCPKLQKFVWEVAHSRPGISSEPVRIRNLKSSKNSAALRDRVPRNDRFSLLIPYCDEQLIWDVIFLCDHPELPPDFHFGDGNFLENIDCQFLEDKVPSLAKWDCNDPKALLNVISELLVIFKYHQLQLIPDTHRAYSELGMVFEGDETVSNIEVVRQNDGIHALIRVLPESLKEADDDFKIILSLNYELRFDRVKANLKSYGEHKFWSDIDNSAVPTFTSDKNLLLDYLPEIQNRIENVITRKLRTIAKRKQLIFQFCVTFKSSLIEFDAVNFLFAVFCLSRENFQFFVRIDLPKNFPQEPPSYKLISNYCFRELLHSRYDRVEYPVSNVKYNAEMSMVDVVQNFFQRFNDVFMNFKKSSVLSVEKNFNALKM